MRRDLYAKLLKATRSLNRFSYVGYWLEIFVFIQETKQEHNFFPIHQNTICYLFIFSLKNINVDQYSWGNIKTTPMYSAVREGNPSQRQTTVVFRPSSAQPRRHIFDSGKRLGRNKEQAVRADYFYSKRIMDHLFDKVKRFSGMLLKKQKEKNRLIFRCFLSTPLTRDDMHATVVVVFLYC